MHACDQFRHALLIFSHPFWTAFHVLPLGFLLVGQGAKSRLDTVHIVHISGVHKQLLFISEDEQPARFHFATLVHGPFDPHVPGKCWSRSCLSLTERSPYARRLDDQKEGLSEWPRSQIATFRTYCCHTLPSMAA